VQAAKWSWIEGMDLLLEYERGSADGWAGQAGREEEALDRAVSLLEAAVVLKDGYGWGVNYGSWIVC
jgi:hypothetical protein